MQAWGLTDCGNKRTVNQDFLRIEAMPVCGAIAACVCDGMGGAASGDVASRTAGNYFADQLTLQIRPYISKRRLGKIVEDVIVKANTLVYKRAMSNPDYAGMGTTLVGGIIYEKHAILVNIGDSRAYLVHDGKITRLTTDHSLVEQMYQNGELSRRQAKKHQNRNIITRALGTDEETQPDIIFQPLCKGDYLLFCTDGLTNFVDEMEILFQILHGNDDRDCPKRLIDLANTRHSSDNITAVLIKV